MDDIEEIYKVSARVKNLARSTGPLTPTGEVLCNLYTHVLMSFYDFAKTLNESDKESLEKLIEFHEQFPEKVISVSKTLLKIRK